MTNFLLRIGDPGKCEDGHQLAEDFAAAIQMIYPMDTVDAYVVWHGISVPLSYKYDVSVIIEDVVGMLEACAGNGSLIVKMNFGSSSFHADWVLDLKAGSVTVLAQWHGVVGGSEEALNQTPSLTLDRRYWADQWLGLVSRVVKDVFESEVRMENDTLFARANTLVQQRMRSGRE